MSMRSVHVLSLISFPLSKCPNPFATQSSIPSLDVRTTHGRPCRRCAGGSTRQTRATYLRLWGGRGFASVVVERLIDGSECARVLLRRVSVPWCRCRRCEWSLLGCGRGCGQEVRNPWHRISLAHESCCGSRKARRGSGRCART